MNNLTPQTISLFGKQAIESVLVEEYVQWSIHMLEEGFESLNLCMLAGLENPLNLFEVKGHFEKSINELGILRKTPDEEIHDYALTLIRSLANKNISPKEALPLLSDICIKTGYNSKYMIWYSLEDARMDVEVGEYPYGFPDAYGKDFADIVSFEAQKYLGIKNRNVQPAHPHVQENRGENLWEKLKRFARFSCQ